MHAARTNVACCLLCLEGLEIDVNNVPGYAMGVQQLLRRSDALMLMWDLATITADSGSPGALARPRKQAVEAFLVCPGEGLAVPPPMTFGRTDISVRVM
jgi:hypothetical protein